MRWIEISLESTPQSSQALSNILIENGCAGTATDCGWTQSPGGEDDLKVVECRHKDKVYGYLPMDDLMESRLKTISDEVRILPALGFNLPSLDVSVTWVDDDKWATAWKQFFKPFHIGKIVIKPTWEDYDVQESDIVVELDPGMAFGTGSHPTTGLCLLIMQDIMDGVHSVLDMGCGSGILSIAAAKLGAQDIVAMDNDSVAVESAIENVRQTGLEDIIKVARADSPKAYDAQADLVVANITANVIMGMTGDLADKVKPGGRLLISGVINVRADEVISALEAHGLKAIDQRNDRDWVAVVLAKENN